MNAPSPAISASVGRDVGVLCAFAIPPGDARVRELEPREIDTELSRADGIVWLHFNLSNARARQIIAQFAFLPEELRETFCNHEQRRRVEVVDGGVLAVFSDLTFEEASEPAEVATLWCYLSGRLFLTGRTHPLQTPDRLRAAVRTGLRVGAAGELLIWILNRRTSSLRDLEVSMSEQVGDIEDEILGGRIREQREQLGRIRRYCAQLRRHFGPDRSAFRRLLQQGPATLGREEIEGLRNEIEDLGFLVDEVAELYERSKLLQEELASRVAENTGRSLYVLAILSAVFLPMTLITGIFGMNVAGLPGLSHHSAFWWVLLLILISGTGTLAMIRRNRS